MLLTASNFIAFILFSRLHVCKFILFQFNVYIFVRYSNINSVNMSVYSLAYKPLHTETGREAVWISEYLW